MDDQLFAVNGCTRRRCHPRERLLRKAGHPIASGAKEVDVVAPAFAGGFEAMSAESPGSVHALNAVKQAGFVKRVESPVDGYPVERFCPSALFEYVLVREGPACMGKQLENGFPGGRSPESVLLQEMSRLLHGQAAIHKIPEGE
jgi:hypothetical protein